MKKIWIWLWYIPLVASYFCFITIVYIMFGQEKGKEFMRDCANDILKVVGQ